MDADRLLAGVIGAVFGALGWLVVGLYIQRRQFAQQGVNAGRAVFFELVINRAHIQVAAGHDVHEPLARSAFDRLLPELATWLPVEELQTVVRAYMGHAGYGQASRDADLPPQARAVILRALLEAHEEALGLLGRRLFNERERERLAAAGIVAMAAQSYADPRSQATGAARRAVHGGSGD